MRKKFYRRIQVLLLLMNTTRTLSEEDEEDTYPLSVARAVQNCILRNVTAHLCLYQSTGTSTINVVDDCMKHRQDVMTSRTEPACPAFGDFVVDSC